MNEDKCGYCGIPTDLYLPAHGALCGACIDKVLDGRKISRLALSLFEYVTTTIEPVDRWHKKNNITNKKLQAILESFCMQLIMVRTMLEYEKIIL